MLKRREKCSQISCVSELEKRSGGLVGWVWHQGSCRICVKFPNSIARHSGWHSMTSFRPLHACVSSQWIFEHLRLFTKSFLFSTTARCHTNWNILAEKSSFHAQLKHQYNLHFLHHHPQTLPLLLFPSHRRSTISWGNVELSPIVISWKQHWQTIVSIIRRLHPFYRPSAAGKCTTSRVQSTASTSFHRHLHLRPASTLATVTRQPSS